jgi:hypothetical protein
MILIMVKTASVTAAVRSVLAEVVEAATVATITATTATPIAKRHRVCHTYSMTWGALRLLMEVPEPRPRHLQRTQMEIMAVSFRLLPISLLETLEITLFFAWTQSGIYTSTITLNSNSFSGFYAIGSVSPGQGFPEGGDPSSMYQVGIPGYGPMAT